MVDVLLAAEVSDNHGLAALRALLFVAFALQIMALGCVAYLCFIFTRSRRSFSKKVAWLEPSAGAGFNAAALAAVGAALIWLLIRQDDQPSGQLGLQTAGLVIWAVVVVLHATFFMLLAIHTRKVLERILPKVQIMDFGIKPPPQKEMAMANGTRPSFSSTDPTLTSRPGTATRPQTPKSTRRYSLQSSTTKVASSIRSKYRGSARSSLDVPPFPAGEATALGSAFDRYDSSNVDMETRNSIMLSSSPTMTRFDPGLEPIPGSRPGSPDDGPPLPTSPTLRQRALGSPIRARRQPIPFDLTSSSPPSSPPNFSRPTSKREHQPAMSEQLRHPRFSASMTDLIHPLFRPGSPNPPQIMTSGTMVTASPLASQTLTPRTLSRLRSASDLQTSSMSPTRMRSASDLQTGSMSPRGKWRVMPAVEPLPPISSRPRSKSYSSFRDKRPNTSGSDSVASTKTSKEYATPDQRPNTASSTSQGSPGPSVVEEDDLPPILPGFVLSAGSRSSLVDYGRRKSIKRDSALLK